MIPTVFASAYTVFPRRNSISSARSSVWSRRWRRTSADRRRIHHRTRLSWHWLFFINIVPASLSPWACLRWSISISELSKLLDRFDWWA